MRKFRVVVNGTTYEVDIEEISTDTSRLPSLAAPASETSATTDRSIPVSSPQPIPSSKPSLDVANGAVVAQMPGTIVDIKVSSGDLVKKGQPLVILEAMKMANEVVAPHDGSVTEVQVEKGASVNAGDILVVLS